MFKKTTKMKSHNLTLTGESNFNGYLTTDGGPSYVTSTSVTFNYYTKKLHDTKVIQDAEGMLIEIIYKMIPNGDFSYVFYGQDQRTKMKKETYGAIDGKMQLIKEVEGYENPGYYVDPEIQWSE